MTLALVADERFAMPLAVSLSACLERIRNVAALELYLFDGGMSKRSKKRVATVAHRRKPKDMTIDIKWIEIEKKWIPDLANYTFRNSDFNETVFYRLAIPEVVPDRCKRVVYLDSDVVVKENIRWFHDAIPPDGPLLAVRDYGHPRHDIRLTPSEYESLGIGHACYYFNSGVLGINVEYWRQHGVRREACDVLESHPEICRWPDQDALNFALAGTWTEAELGWNVQTGGPDRIRRLGGSEIDFLGEPYEQVRRRAKIVHFTGIKPWKQGYTNPDRPAFVEALRRSGWFNPLAFRAWQVRWWISLMRRALSRKRGG
jgi:lipopolysaccharide biosynthesis glycosyltransferase